MPASDLPVPPHFDASRVGEIWPVPYQERAREAEAWARDRGLSPAHQDARRICLLPVDVQNTFCIPGHELYVGGRSGQGAVDDCRRLCAFIYSNLGQITEICPTLDTHQAMQIFHTLFLVDERGEHPAPFSVISPEDVESGRWTFNEDLAPALGLDAADGGKHLLHYVRRLERGGKYQLTIWPYHAMLGGIGHALVAAVEEAIFFHGIARRCRPDFQIKGHNPLTENYSVLRPEVLEDAAGRPIARRNAALIEKLLAFDAVIIAGEAKSHCVAWTIDDLLKEIGGSHPELASKVYLLEDCTSPVVVPGVIDYTDEADAAFARFAAAGMHLVSSTEPLASWPGFDLAQDV